MAKILFFFILILKSQFGEEKYELTKTYAYPKTWASQHVRGCQLRRDSDAAIITQITTTPVDFCAADKPADKFIIFSLFRKCFVRVNTLCKQTSLCGARVMLQCCCPSVSMNFSLFDIRYSKTQLALSIRFRAQNSCLKGK